MFGNSQTLPQALSADSDGRPCRATLLALSGQGSSGPQKCFGSTSGQPKCLGSRSGQAKCFGCNLVNQMLQALVHQDAFVSGQPKVLCKQLVNQSVCQLLVTHSTSPTQSHSTCLASTFVARERLQGTSAACKALWLTRDKSILVDQCLKHLVLTRAACKALWQTHFG